MILGISFGYHDSAAAIIDKDIIAFSLEERFSRIKHDKSFPTNAIEFCLEEANINIKDIEKVVYYEDTLLKFDRILGDIQKLSYKNEIISSYINKLDIKEYIANEINISKDKIEYLTHHLSHASSAFISPFENCGILVIDGVGEKDTLSIWKKEYNNLTKLYQISFPHSIGLLYSVFTAFLGFEVNEGEYKVMGLAPYGEAKYKDMIYLLIKQIDNFLLDESYFDFYSKLYPFNDKFLKMFGNPKKNSDYDLLKDKYYADIAASIQAVVEELIFFYIQKTINLTKEKNIVFCGGVALNSVANAKIKDNFNINFFVPPDPSDGGSALYSAIYYQKVKNKKDYSYRLKSPFLGKKYNKNDIKKAMEEQFFGDYEYIPNKNEFLKKVAYLLSKNNVIGWFWDRFEFGPRALGHRSILASPISENMKDIINKKIKFRESFRPFAPSILDKYAKEYFEIDKLGINEIESYMLGVNKTLSNKIPAVTHKGTSRVQVVFKENNQMYYDLIKEFYNITNIPVLLNTSFNLKGEPIVNSPKEAILTFSYSYMDYLAMFPYILKR